MDAFQLFDSGFIDADVVIKKYYKEIFETELFQMWTDENDWPPKITLKLFHEWFSVEISGWVYDLDKLIYRKKRNTKLKKSLNEQTGNKK